MEWATEIIKELGGGPMAVGTVALAFLFWKERQRSNGLVERLIEKSDALAADTLLREKETLTTLNNLVSAIKGSAG